MSAELVLKAVADSTRLKILLSLLDKPKFVEELAMELNITLSTASFHLKKLQSAGFVVSQKEQYYQTYSINPLMLEKSLLEIIGENRTVAESKFRLEVISECFVGDKLIKLPIQIKKRQVIYDEITKKFKVGKYYSDREANLLISEFFDDFIMLRKELEQNGYLVRSEKGLIRYSEKIKKEKIKMLK